MKIDLQLVPLKQRNTNVFILRFLCHFWLSLINLYNFNFQNYRYQKSARIYEKTNLILKLRSSFLIWFKLEKWRFLSLKWQLN